MAAAFPKGLTGGTGFGGGTGFCGATAFGPNPVVVTANADAGGRDSDTILVVAPAGSGGVAGLPVTGAVVLGLLATGARVPRVLQRPATCRSGDATSSTLRAPKGQLSRLRTYGIRLRRNSRSGPGCAWAKAALNEAIASAITPSAKASACWMLW